MGSGSEDEDEDGSAHHHHGGVGGPHLGPHNLGPGGPGDQTVGHTGDLPLGSDPCKQEDSEDQGRSTLLWTLTVTFDIFSFFFLFFTQILYTFTFRFVIRKTQILLSIIDHLAKKIESNF